MPMLTVCQEQLCHGTKQGAGSGGTQPTPLTKLETEIQIMAAINSTSSATFEIGTRVDQTGRIIPFATGELDVAMVEQIAARLLSLAHSVRAEARAAVLPS